MKSIKGIFSALFVLAVAFFLTINISSCSRENIVSMQETSEGQTAQETVMSDHGPIKLLQTDAQSIKPLEKSRLDSIFYAVRLVQARFGGDLTVGNILSGFSSISFGPLSLYDDTIISFQYIAGNTLEAHFRPHGIQFRRPARLTLSYKSANLEGVDENSLRVYYFNEETQIWELIGGIVNKLTKTVTVEITHFSRYALAHS